jgi:hypothetical protein
MRAMGRMTWLVVSVVALLHGAPSRAAIVDWLYDVDVPVADRTAGERIRGAREALSILVARVSGERDASRRDAVVQALRAPERYFVGYEYHPDPRKVPPLSLSVKFAPAAVRELIVSAGLPTWSRSRPAILGWVAIDADGERRVVGSGDGHPLSEALVDAARQRGVVLALPVMDPESEPEVATDAVWNRRWSDLENAGLRYAAQGLLIGRVTLTSTGHWLANWTYHTMGAVPVNRDAAVDVATPELAAAAGVDVVVDELVTRYAVPNGPITDVAVQVTNTASIRSYAALLRYLGTLDYVENVSVDRVHSDAVDLRLHTRVAWPQLQELFAIDALLAPAETGSSVTMPSRDARQLVWRAPSS